MTDVATPGVPWAVIDPVITVSFSGNAFSVINGRGRFKLPRGQAFSTHRLRRWSMTLLIWAWVSRSLNDGMIWEKARAGPPFVMMARHCTSGSGDAVGQSLKSGKVDGRSKPARFCDCPFPSGPWHETHPPS